MNASDWRPTAAIDTLRLRARMKSRLRAFFDQRGVLEVDTPMLSSAAPSDPHIQSLSTRIEGEAAPRFLQTSPEFPMKRLLAAGSGDCWQLARVFRDGERGHLHVPEFDLLEWYRVGFDHRALMEEVEALVHAVAGPERAVPPALSMSYQDAFGRAIGVDPLAATAPELRAAAAAQGLSGVAGLDPADRDGWLDLLLTGVVLPRLTAGRLVFVHSWPASQAALARLEPDDDRVARRFELYWGGIELANGYHELADAEEQRRRFEADTAHRARLGRPATPVDERLLAALAAGLPDCAGVALGFDRLCLCAAGAAGLDQVLAFVPERA